MEMPCPHDICDGSGYVESGAFDYIDMKKCLCAVEKGMDDTNS